MPLVEKRQLTAPRVTIKNGTVVGSSTLQVDSFKGIPCAQPPTETLRLKPPQPIAVPFGTISAIDTPTTCP
jgi:carboxylesterase type B